MVAVVGVRRVTIDATVLAYVKGPERGHALLGRVPRPGAQNNVFAPGLNVDSEDITLCGLGRMEVAVMNFQQPASLYRITIDLLAVAGGDCFSPVVLVEVPQN